MGAPPKKSGFLTELEKQLTEELKASRKKDTEGNFIMPFLDRMRLFDRGLKLEAIKSKMDDQGYGSGFDD